MLRIEPAPCRIDPTMAALFAVLLALSGCMIPFPGHKVYEGKEIKAESLAWLRAGETTRAQVTEKLGAPDIDFVDERTIAYAWAGQSGGVLLVAPYSAFAEQIRMRRALMIRFDPGNRVVAFSVISRPTEIIPYDVHAVSLDAKYDDWRVLLDQWFAESARGPGKTEAAPK